MRRTRLGSSARALSSKLVFVLIALAFVGSGYFIGRYFLSSLFQDKPGTGEPVSGEPQGGEQTTARLRSHRSGHPLQGANRSFLETRKRRQGSRDGRAKGCRRAVVMSPDPL